MGNQERIDYLQMICKIGQASMIATIALHTFPTDKIGQVANQIMFTTALSGFSADNMMVGFVHKQIVMLFIFSETCSLFLFLGFGYNDAYFEFDTVFN